jgi:hypothetical protein
LRAARSGHSAVLIAARHDDVFGAGMGIGDEESLNCPVL